ncbi:hypothetical protein ACKWTF_008410 [Chironomus riparius]
MLVLRIIRINHNRSLTRKFRQMCSKSNFSDDKTNSVNENELKTDSSIELPPEPDNCCMSGCENCVWKQYAADLTDLYNVSGDNAKKIILEKIKDPTMQVFLKMELDLLDKKK